MPVVRILLSPPAGLRRGRAQRARAA